MKKSVHQQQGLSLVELLISIALGLMLIAGALTMLLNSRDLYRSTDGQARIQENGRFAMDFLAQHIRMAGHLTAADDDAIGLVAMNTACGGLDPCSANGAGTNSDSIGLVMNPSDDVDCLGTAVNQNDVVVNVFSIADVDGDGIDSLYCQGFTPNNVAISPNRQPLVDGIENMQILYGLLDDDNQITQYVTADNVGNTSRWGRIGAIRVQFLANNGFVNGNGRNEQRTFDLPNGPSLTFNDRHERQVYSTTIIVSNTIYPEPTI